MQSIEATEDRKLFAEAMAQIGEAYTIYIVLTSLRESLLVSLLIRYQKRSMLLIKLDIQLL